MVFRSLGLVDPVTLPDGVGLKGPLDNLLQSFVDNVFRDGVEPEPGCVVYCELLGQAEHSGIYVGDGHIVHLNGDGLIESVSPSGFMARLSGRNTAISIYVSSRDGVAVGQPTAARRARERVGSRCDYSLLGNNCHRFSATCLSGDPDCSVRFMSELRQEAVRHLGCNEWRVWTR